MSVLGVDDFKAKLKGGGARPNLFKATLNFPIFTGGDVELTSFMCKAASLPGSVAEAIPVFFRGRQLQTFGDRYFEPWSVSIINDTDFGPRNSLIRWMNGINAHSANTGFTDPNAYQADMIVEQLDRDGSSIARYDFRGTFPINVSPIQVGYDITGTIEEFQVDFAVQYWDQLGVTS
jgi:hypothetical protein